MRIGLFSDVHLTRKPYRLVRALQRLEAADILLIVGDIADRGTPEQFALAGSLLDTHFPDKPIFTVSGNHDIPQNDPAPYRAFVGALGDRLGRFAVEDDPSGAYYVRLNEEIDLLGLNPLYHQKLFRFPDRGAQLAFGEQRLAESPCGRHLILCHPPLLRHNPLRTADMPAYLPAEQDARLQALVDAHPGCLFLSGHTHTPPTVEADPLRGNLYINDGSLCPVFPKLADTCPTGNVMLLTLGEGTPQAKVLPLWEKRYTT